MSGKNDNSRKKKNKEKVIDANLLQWYYINNNLCYPSGLSPLLLSPLINNSTFWFFELYLFGNTLVIQIIINNTFYA
jgi:hypothetical protein